MTRVQEIVDRLAANIYCADREIQKRPIVLWGMLPPSKQLWYVTAAKGVLRNAASRRKKVAPPPERPLFVVARRRRSGAAHRQRVSRVGRTQVLADAPLAS